MSKGILLVMDEELLKKYNEGIPDKLNTLRELCESLRETPTNENISALRFFVHKLKGNSGMYGYLEVSEVCGRWEDFLVEKLKSPSDDWSWISDLVELESSVQKGFEKEVA